MKVSICHSQIKNSSSDIQLYICSSIKENWIHGLVFIFKNFLNFRNCVCVCVCRFRKALWSYILSLIEEMVRWLFLYNYPGIFLVMNLGNFSFLTTCVFENHLNAPNLQVGLISQHLYDVWDLKLFCMYTTMQS